ncbi:MAG: hypothetical protein MUP47_03605 [Phycisphaerae bacterium]|nr:hypothetical protein [Phycisphaerae bacterium]
MTVLAARPPSARPTVHQDGDCIVIHIPMTFRRCNGRKQIVLLDGVAPKQTPDADARCPLKVALARAFRWQKMIESGEVKSNCDLARRLKLDQSYIARTIRLASLAPDIVEAVLRGDELSGLSLRSLRGEIPLSWDEQAQLVPVRLMRATVRKSETVGADRADTTGVASESTSTGYCRSKSPKSV